MFLNNRYTLIYFRLIQRAKIRISISGYYERHHIIPVALTGSNLCDNLVALTAKEHFLCHRLLCKMVSGRDKYLMTFALLNMSQTSKDRPRWKATAQQYQHIREQVSLVQKEYYATLSSKERSERFGYWKNKTHDEKTKAKMSLASLGVKKHQNMRQIFQNQKEELFYRLRIGALSLSHIGVKQTHERKANTSAIMKQWWAERKSQQVIAVVGV